MAQLMPLPLAISCFSKIQIGFTFLVPAYPGRPGKRAVKRVCVCVCVCWYADVAQRFAELPVAGRVCGIAQLADDILVASDSSTVIAVFALVHGRQQVFTSCAGVRFSELCGPPRDVAASEEFQRLFVADIQCVWQLHR